jgi:CRP-like cAMP-binding protein
MTLMQLFKFLRAIYPLSNELRDHLENVVTERNIAKKEYLLRAGHVCRSIYFVEKGLLRSYYTKGNKIITSAFTKESEFCVLPGSFFGQQPGIEHIQALEDCIICGINYEEYEQASKNFNEFNILVRILLEECVRLREQRLQETWMQPSRDRYNWLFTQMPDLWQRVPAKYIASYLGITETMLSCLRSGRK